MADEKNGKDYMPLALISLVAIVAIVSIIMLFMNNAVKTSAGSIVVRSAGSTLSATAPLTAPAAPPKSTTQGNVAGQTGANDDYCSSLHEWILENERYLNDYCGINENGAYGWWLGNNPYCREAIENQNTAQGYRAEANCALTD